ncbi:MAG TPA: cyclic nucleotide-binding domain-containing protein [Sandaracinaceae bacterium]
MRERAWSEDAGLVQERILELRRVPALRALPARSLADVARAVDVETRAPRPPLIVEGGTVRSVAWVLRGSVRWAHGGRALGRSEEGASVGLLEVLAGAPARASVTADGEVELARVSADRFFELLEDSFDLVEALLRAIASELAMLGARTLSRAAGLEVSGALPSEVDFTERLVRLRTSRPFVRAPIRALATLAQRGRVRRWARGARLWERGAPAREIAVLLAGEVREARAAHRAGETLGLVEALAACPHGATAVAHGPVVAHVFDVDALTDVLEDDEELSLTLLRTCAEELLAERLARGLAPDLASGPPERSLPRALRAADTSG